MKVLIVDDDMATVDCIREQVDWAALGIDGIYSAYNISQAKDVILEHGVDVVVTDIEMPQGDGIDLLRWFREEGRSGEFIVLTCHESFNYATQALKLQAAEYLLKPLDIATLTMALRKTIEKRREALQTADEQRIGRWAKKNSAGVQLAFLRSCIEGRLTGDAASEIEESGLDLSVEKNYRLIVANVTDTEAAGQGMSSGLFSFIIENVFSEILTGNPENRSVLCQSIDNRFFVQSLCEDESKSRLTEKCRSIIAEIRKITGATVSCCVSRTCTLEKLHDAGILCSKLIMNAVSRFGDVFFEEEISNVPADRAVQLDEEKLLSCLEEHNRLQFMSCLKETVTDLEMNKSLDTDALSSIARIVFKVVYTFFAKNDISSEDFFKDDTAQTMTKKSERSVVDMMKWANYLIEQAFLFEKSAMAGSSPIDKINHYIHLHYMEEISRNEIAEELHFSPEYVSKLYRKETGKSLGDAISEYRIEKAKILLQKGGLSVSEIARSCGFDNSTYFSTIFKKYVGITPNEFRKSKLL